MVKEYLTKEEIKKRLKPSKEKLGLNYYSLMYQIEKREKEKKQHYLLRIRLENNL